MLLAARLPSRESPVRLGSCLLAAVTADAVVEDEARLAAVASVDEDAEAVLAVASCDLPGTITLVLGSPCNAVEDCLTVAVELY